MSVLFTNNAVSSLQAPIVADATNITISAIDASAFPQPVASTDYFIVTLEDRLQNPPLREIVRCTARSGNTLVIVRAQEGTTAAAFGTGATVAHRLTAGTLQQIVANAASPVQLYLGPFTAAPTTGSAGDSLVAGNLYYDTTMLALRSYNGAAWTTVAPGGHSTTFGVYLGAFSSPPITMPDSTALVLGTIYTNTVDRKLYEWDGSGWVAVDGATPTNTTTPTPANQTVQGNLVVQGDGTVQGNLVVGGNGTFDSIAVKHQTSTGTLMLGGHLVVDAGDMSGSASSQNFPAGTSERWGTAVTGAGGTATVLFSPPFNTACDGVWLTLCGVPVAATIELLAPPNAASFGAYARTTNSQPGSAQFYWLAKGH